MNWFPLGLTYATFYMGRYNLNVSSKTIMDNFHINKSEFGFIASAGFWTYALSVIFNGPLTDRIGGKKSILIGALGAASLNLIIGLLFSKRLANQDSRWNVSSLRGQSVFSVIWRSFNCKDKRSLVSCQGKRNFWRHFRNYDLKRLFPGYDGGRLDFGLVELVLGFSYPIRRHTYDVYG